MKKIIIYGIENIILCKNIEFFLDDDYEIIGYSDTYYCINDTINGKKFIPLGELLNFEFDYILLSSHSKITQEDMRKNLSLHNIPSEKIVAFTMLSQPARSESFDLIADIHDYYQEERGLIFGLSYSAYGILKKMLKTPYYDCSVSSLDLYYNFQIYMYMKKMGLLSKVEKVLLVFPYYYFNYDASLSLTWYQNWQMCCVWQLDDYHNHGDLRGGVDDYIVNYRMFARKFSQFYRSNKFDKTISRVYQGQDHGGQLDEKRFYDRHEKTIEENRNVFLNFIKEIYMQKIEPVLVIPPFYLKGLDVISQNMLKEKKELFYQIVQETEEKTQKKIKIFDYVDVFADRQEFFRDLTHLNTAGAEEFTRLINQNIL